MSQEFGGYMTWLYNVIPIITTLFPNSRVVDLGPRAPSAVLRSPRCCETSATLGVTEPYFGA